MKNGLLILFLLTLLFSPDFAKGAPADKATVALRKPLRFNRPAANIDLTRLKNFHLGRSFFELPWIPAPASTTARDGLGPLFNVNTCRGCHVKGGRGDAPEGSGPLVDSTVLRLALKNAGDPIYGNQLQPRSIGLSDGNKLNFVGEGTGIVKYQFKTVVLTDGTNVELRQPNYSVKDLRYGPLNSNTAISARIGPSLIGLGLVEEIPEEQILKHEDVNDKNSDGISGKANRVPDAASGKLKLGRFGHKAKQPSLLQQAADAFRNDIGITSSLFPTEVCTAHQQDCRAYVSRTTGAGKVEVDSQILSAVAYHVSLFGVPDNRGKSLDLSKGKNLFHKVGCSSCHVASFTTRDDASIPEFSSLKVYPYSDFLLHDMGDELADGVSDYLANGREWRTAPLWGIGLAQHANPKAAFLHDGRARTIEEAILWHGGEASPAAEAYKSLSRDEREALIKFIRSL